MNRLINNKLISIFRHNNIPHVVIVDMKKDAVNCLSGEEVNELMNGLSQEKPTQKVTDVLIKEWYRICEKCANSDYFTGLPGNSGLCTSCCIFYPTNFRPKE